MIDIEKGKTQSSSVIEKKYYVRSYYDIPYLFTYVNKFNLFLQS